MAITLGHTSSGDTPNETINQDNNGGGVEYLRISDYEPISSQEETHDSNGHEIHPAESHDQQSNAQNGSTITYNGMEIHVFGNIGGLTAGLQMGNGFANDKNYVDSDEEEEEERRREEAEIAIREANRADAERRSAPLHPETSSAIMNAMRGVTLQGFRPDWADTIPEDQWIDRLRTSIQVPPES